jgi:hypothetical protein
MEESCAFIQQKFHRFLQEFYLYNVHRHLASLDVGPRKSPSVSAVIKEKIATADGKRWRRHVSRVRDPWSMCCVQTSCSKLVACNVDHSVIRPRETEQFSNKFYRIYMTWVCFLEKGVWGDWKDMPYTLIPPSHTHLAQGTVSSVRCFATKGQFWLEKAAFHRAALYTRGLILILHLHPPHPPLSCGTSV